MPLRPDRPVVSLAEAQAIVDSIGEPITRAERLPLEALAGRVLAEPVRGTIDVPPYDRAAMDGYAVDSRDLAGATAATPVRLRVVDTAYTGYATSTVAHHGACVAIATGAPMPPGADAVVMIEQTTRHGDAVEFPARAEPGQNIGRRGADIAAGAIALEAGAWLTPGRAGCLAALGLTSALVYERPRVAILATGDEVVPPGSPLGPGQIYDVNTTTLAAVVRAHGGEAAMHPTAPDDIDRLRAAFRATLDADLVLLTGGSSVGERDFILDVMEEAGRILVHGLAVKPGKPTIVGVVAGRPVFGMPGNPTSCLSNGYLLVAPLLRRMARLPPAVPVRVRARLSRRVTSPAGRHQFFTVRIEEGMAVPAFKGSGEITSIADADGYFEIDAECQLVEAGTPVDVTLF